MDQDGGPRVLALSHRDVRSPWRLTIPLRALAARGYRVRELPATSEPAEPSFLNDVDLLILHCPVEPKALDLLADARVRDVVTIVDVDDLFLPGQLPIGAPMSLAWDPNFLRREAELQALAGVARWEAVTAAPRNTVMERLHAALRAADAVTVSTASLAEAYAPFNREIHVLPNCYDDADPLWALEPPSRPTVRIGFAGTDHHAGNLALLEGALEPVLRDHPEARLVEAGGPVLLRRVQAPAHQLVYLGSIPFEVFPLLLREIDVVLAPLADEPFMRGKSNIRCMMAGLVGAPVVASPVGPYASYVRHGENGFFAQSREEWTAYVERLTSDAALRQRMGAANRRCAETFAVSRHIAARSALYERLLRRAARTSGRAREGKEPDAIQYA